ncbi:MAG: hypothetical protein K2M36_01640, partial [Clostridia bacterium]|nr:hypothetical protein [Clostridia bacterium]
MGIPSVLQLKNLGEKLAKLDGIGAPKLTDGKLAAVSVMRVTEGAKAHIIAALKCRRLVVTADALGAKSLAHRLASWGVRVRYLPYRDDMLLSRKGFAKDNVLERMKVLAEIVRGEADIVVTSADSLLQRFPSRRLVERFTVTVKKEGIISPIELADRLALAGYRRQEMIGDMGEFAVRGDIVDVYAPDKTAYRINFFDEIIEDIKVIDVESMRSSNEVEEIVLPPLSDILVDEDSLKSALANTNKHMHEKNCAQARSNLCLGACDPSAVWALPFISDCTQPLLEYFDCGEPTVVVFDEPKLVFDKLNILMKEFDGRIKTLSEGGEILPLHKNVYITVHELKRLLLTMRKMSFSAMNLSNPIFDPTYVIEPKTRAVTKYYLDPTTVANDIKTFVLNGAKVIFACGSAEHAKGVMASLTEDGIGSQYSEDGEGDGSVLVTPLSVDTGVIYPALKAVLIGVSECVGKRIDRSKESTYSPKQRFNAPKAGDYVVHRVHGVGLCEGTTLLKTGEFEREYIVLKYRDGDTLYVATDQMNNLQKFVGEETPTLNKIGGKEFEREKEKVRKSVRKLAVNLVELYAKREKQRGYKYSEDTVWQKTFEDDFEYEETADQLRAIADIKQDM